MAIQTALPRKDISTGTALVFFAQSLGGWVFISTAQNVFAPKFTDYLEKVEGIDVRTVTNAGAMGLRHVVEPESLPMVLGAFVGALVKTFYRAVAVSCGSVIRALCVEWRNIKKLEGRGQNMA